MKIRLFIKPDYGWYHQEMRRVDERLKIGPASVTH
jgi:hypothetical protein